MLGPAKATDIPSAPGTVPEGILEARRRATLIAEAKTVSHAIETTGERLTVTLQCCLPTD